MQLDINEINTMRKRFNLTQAELAKRAGVSQSLIAKIENHRIDPTYSKVRKILDFLNGLSDKEESEAGEFMVKKIIFVEGNESVSKAIDKIKRHAISQLPVFKDNHVVGLVSEASILEAVSEGRKVGSLNVSDVMDEAPPIVPKTTKRKVVLDLLSFYPIVLVSDKGRPVGVVSKADILREFSKRPETKR